MFIVADIVSLTGLELYAFLMNTNLHTKNTRISEARTITAHTAGTTIVVMVSKSSSSSPISSPVEELLLFFSFEWHIFPQCTGLVFLFSNSAECNSKKVSEYDREEIQQSYTAYQPTEL